MTTGSSRGRSRGSSCAGCTSCCSAARTRDGVGFYDAIFTALRVPYEPVRWVTGHPRGGGGQDRPGDRVDRRLPHPRAPDGRHRPAELPPAPPPRPRRALPRPDPVGSGPHVRHRRVRRAGAHEAARRARAAARLLRAHRRHRVHAHRRPRAAGLVAGTHRGAAPETRGGRTEIHPGQAQRRRGVRDVPADQVRRAETLLARRRGDRHPAAGRGAGQGRRTRARRGRHRHAAPRPAQRAGQHRRQADQPDLPRVRGQPRPRPGPRLRRRQIPPRRRGQVLPHVRRRRDHRLPGLEPVAPRSRRPRPGRDRPGQAGPARQGRQRTGLLGDAADAARRRRVRRPGRGRRNPQPRPAARLPHRRHRARGHQQPGRVHHRPRSIPLEPVLHRRGEDDRRTGVPRQRRRPRSLRLGRQARRGLPAALEQRRRDRHDLLPPPRPQRGRRPLDDPTLDVRHHRRQTQRPKDLHRVPHRPRRHLRRRSRTRPQGLQQPARQRLPGST